MMHNCCCGCTGSCITEDSPNTVTTCVSCAEIASEVYTFSITVDGFSEVSGSRKLYHGTVTSSCSAEEMVIDAALTCVWTSCRISVSGSVYQWKLTVGASPTKVELIKISGTDHIGYIKYITDTFDCNCAQTFTLDSGEGEGDTDPEDVPDTICVRPFFDVCCCTCWVVTCPTLGTHEDLNDNCFSRMIMSGAEVVVPGYGAPLFPAFTVELASTNNCDIPGEPSEEYFCHLGYSTEDTSWVNEDDPVCEWKYGGPYPGSSGALSPGRSTGPLNVRLFYQDSPSAFVAESNVLVVWITIYIDVCDVFSLPYGDDFCGIWIRGIYKSESLDCGFTGSLDYVETFASLEYGSRGASDPDGWHYVQCPDQYLYYYPFACTDSTVFGDFEDRKRFWPESISVYPTTCGNANVCNEATTGCVYHGVTSGEGVKASASSTWTACVDLGGTTPCDPDVDPNLFELNEVWWTYPGEDNSCPDGCLCPCSNCCRFYEIYGVPEIDQEIVVGCTHPA